MAAQEVHPPAANIPRSPKRARDGVADVDSASKKSKTASPNGHDVVYEAAAAAVPETGQDTTNTETAAAARISRGNEKSGVEGAAPSEETGSRQQPRLDDAMQESAADEEAGVAAAATTEAATTQEPGLEEETSPEAVPSKAPASNKMCGVCREKEGKYKCTRCALPFCSVPCNKIHRENHPPDPESGAKPTNSSSIQTGGRPPPSAKPSSDPNNPFSVLDNSDQLRYLFKRYPSLQARLLEIIAAMEPPAEMQASGNSLNDVMKARALAAANPRKGQWTHDVGIRNGKEALRKARNAAGEDGEGVREYIEFINHIVSQAGEDAAEAEEAIRRQAAQRDAELIRRLMAEDRG